AEFAEVPIGKVLIDHARIKVAGPTGRNLLRREPEALESVCVIFGLNVAGKDGNAFGARKSFERLLEQRGFPRTGRTDQVHNQDIVLPKAFAQFGSDAIILAQDLLFKRYSVHTPPTLRRRVAVLPR